MNCSQIFLRTSSRAYLSSSSSSSSSHSSFSSLLSLWRHHHLHHHHLHHHGRRRLAIFSIDSDYHSRNTFRNQSYAVPLSVPKLSISKMDINIASLHTDVRQNQHPNTSTTIAERWVAGMPARLIPYAVLMRWTKPTGTLLLLWPCYWSIALAAPGGTFPAFNLLALFTIGAVALRSSGCIINDIWDRRFDASVERTKTRPLAANQISIFDAILLSHGLNAIGLLVILQFDIRTIALAFASMAFVVTYPAAKRFTDWPQACLGLAFNWGAILGWSAVTSGSIDLVAVLSLYIAGINWTLIYDTIYAHQDTRDDARLGLRSTALHFGAQTRQYLYAFTGVMTAALAVCGIHTGQCWPFYASAAACGGTLARIIRRTDFDNPDRCAKAFRSSANIGWILFAGIVASTLLKQNEEKNGAEVVNEPLGDRSAKVAPINDCNNLIDCSTKAATASINQSPLHQSETINLVL